MSQLSDTSSPPPPPQDEPSPPHPEAYPIPTQTYPREYFTVPASKSQDRVVGQGPPQHWQGMEDRERVPMMDSMQVGQQVRLLSPPSKTVSLNLCFPPQRVNHSQEDLYPPPGGLRPDERLLPHYPQDYQHPHRDLDYPRAPPGGEGGDDEPPVLIKGETISLGGGLLRIHHISCSSVPAGHGGPDHWPPQPQVSSSLESSTSSQEHLNFSASSLTSKTSTQKTGPGRWKTPNAPHAVPPHMGQPPSRSDLPPPPPPPPAPYPDPYDHYDPQTELPLPPPPTVASVTAQQVADRRKREEQQRWYEKEKARLEEER